MMFNLIVTAVITIILMALLFVVFDRYIQGK
jgi:hypothetical protein